nr:MAG: hypothetical protein [Microvirus Sku122]
MQESILILILVLIVMNVASTILSISYISHMIIRKKLIAKKENQTKIQAEIDKLNLMIQTTDQEPVKLILMDQVRKYEKLLNTKKNKGL